MTTIELQQWRESFIERYLNKIDDMETVLKIEKYMKRIMSKAVSYTHLTLPTTPYV